MATSTRGEYFDENTLFKVFHSLRAAGLSEEATLKCITEMQGKGLLFRERKPEPPVVYRGDREGLLRSKPLVVINSAKPPGAA